MPHSWTAPPPSSDEGREPAAGTTDAGRVQALTTSRETPRHDLAALSSPARQAALVAAVLGSTVSFEHVAAMLETPPASLLAPMEELIAADLLEHANGALRFPHEALRHAVSENLPRSARQALCRQAIDLLLAAGCSPLEPAVDLAASAEAGDRVAVAALHTAACAVARSDACAALEICRRAFELTELGDERRPVSRPTSPGSSTPSAGPQRARLSRSPSSTRASRHTTRRTCDSASPTCLECCPAIGSRQDSGRWPIRSSPPRNAPSTCPR